mmetsp:Transcript_2519/g.8212  ORF Transcript_2519/g.8212 Transcript_2519/m.8212 type:complete len:102 (+) Transcript_2519:2477-2782(+)
MENRGSTIETRELAVAGGRRDILSRERARRRRRVEGSRARERGRELEGARLRIDLLDGQILHPPGPVLRPRMLELGILLLPCHHGLQTENELPYGHEHGRQ